LNASVEAPMLMCSYASVRPSWAIESSTSTEPYCQPLRDPISRCGTCVIDSIPAATTTVASPSRSILLASMTAVSPDRHTLFTATACTSQPMPAPIAA
jgi:hypothetical protein